jgi:dTDP-glucose 4,6-dehydratase
MKYVITGALGFIGSTFVRYLLENDSNSSIICIARKPDQRKTLRLEGAEQGKRCRILYRDLYKDDIYDVFDNVDAVYHLAAKTFVDHSIRDPQPFIQDNIGATFKILEALRKHDTVHRFFYISTDEVFGSIESGSYTEDSPLNPTNPYAATKAAAEMLTLSYHNTYGLPIIITRTENVYGAYQEVVKVFPVFTRKALNNEPLPVYGDGKHIRQWLYVEDKCRALHHLLEHGEVGEKYNIAGNRELMNIELAYKILDVLGKPHDMVKYIPDFNIRPGHDRRYALDSSKIRGTGWEPRWSLDEGIRATVEWYRDNQWWYN